jgi:hypothetical protein
MTVIHALTLIAIGTDLSTMCDLNNVTWISGAAGYRESLLVVAPELVERVDAEFLKQE